MLWLYGGCIYLIVKGKRGAWWGKGRNFLMVHLFIAVHVCFVLGGLLFRKGRPDRASSAKGRTNLKAHQGCTQITPKYTFSPEPINMGACKTPPLSTHLKLTISQGLVVVSSHKSVTDTNMNQ